MATIGKLTVTTKGDREVAITREFDAPRHLVFDALTTPELLRRWMSGPPGFTMTECEFDARTGGSYRYAWRQADGAVMGIRGLCKEVKRPELIVATERFDVPWFHRSRGEEDAMFLDSLRPGLEEFGPGETVVSQRLVEHNGKTTLNMTLSYDSQETRDLVMKTGATMGMESGYDKLDELLAGAKGSSAAPTFTPKFGFEKSAS
jgi:uncharacterized protein YndB with AHSA1/START domain